MMKPLAALAVSIALLTGCQATSQPTEVSMQQTKWQWVDARNEDGRITLQIIDGQVGGKAGCNNYSGMVQQQGNEISFGPLISTRMACIPPWDEIEFDYLQTLELVKGYQLQDNQLSLLDANGQVLLNYTPAPEKD